MKFRQTIYERTLGSCRPNAVVHHSGNNVSVTNGEYPSLHSRRHFDGIVTRIYRNNFTKFRRIVQNGLQIINIVVSVMSKSSAVVRLSYIVIASSL